jgi:predicted phosphodiesterase
MRIALLSDIHANREAFEACLAAARRAGADRFVLLGDFVGYGADPEWTVDTVIALVEAGAVAVRGNHDEAATAGPRPTMNDVASQSARWTHECLSPAQRRFLSALPDTVRDGPRLYVHANAVAPRNWGYVVDRSDAVRSMQATDCSHVFCGHVHEPRLYHLSRSGKAGDFEPSPGMPVPVPGHRQWLAIPGSVGQPRDGNPAACWALLDVERGELTFHREPYDHDRAAAKVLTAGLPPVLAARLRDGR